MMENKSIIMFDGVCNLCNWFVNFIIARDKKNRFQFGSLQSAVVIDLLRRHDFLTSDLSTVILLENEKLYYQSTAVLRILRMLGGVWSLMYVFIVLPKPLRDFMYNLIARHRYKLFGRQDTCMIPTPELKAKFVG
ncbi:MAG TPA: thiol-disulfide oxidoreductase DCC family protein [Cyclobacteriaceae bacterium]|nr:thiol-disulfide oxidoreductase DCC family protein [Cyclobacteriaceae bacterium]